VKVGLEIQVAKISGFVVLQFIAPENIHSYVHEESHDTELHVPEIKNHTGISGQHGPTSLAKTFSEDLKKDVFMWWIGIVHSKYCPL
jgi:hypothetical protein